jgi:hypothetical protein
MGNIVDVSEVLLEMGLSGSATDEERALVNAAITNAEGAVKRHLKYDPLRATRTEYYPRQNLNPMERLGVWETNDTTAYLRRESVVVGDELQILHIPIRSITTLHVDYDGRFGKRSGSFGSETLKTEGDDYWAVCDSVDDDGNSICRDGIIRSSGAWPSSPGSVKIVYVAGYSLEELHGQKALVDASPIVETIVAEASRRARKALLWKKNDAVGWAAGPFTSEKLGDYGYTIDSALSARLFGSSFSITAESREALNDFVNYGATLTS